MAASLPVPVLHTLQEVHSDLNTATQQSVRWDHLASEFERFFGRRPTHIARAPGRVNLIGEHIDYALFGVFPAAIERDILVACAPREGDYTGHVVAENIDAKYDRQSFTPVKDTSNNWHLEIDKTQLRWESYVKAGYYGVLEHFFRGQNEKPVGCDILVTGSVPAGSGLSSSAAMVVASTLAFLIMNKNLIHVTKGSLVEMAMENEKRVGVNSGGMDQAASVISTAQSALYITFHPRLSAELIPLPVTSPRSVFVCANSLVVADKVVSSKYRYNLRVVETLVAARVLARRLRVPVGKDEKVTLKQVVDRFLGVREGEQIDASALKEGLERIIEEVDGLKQGNAGQDDDTGLTLEEMVELSGLTSPEFHQLYLSWVDVEATHFQLYKRTRHVLAEALRVLRFREVCLRDAHSSSDSTRTLEDLGQLMNESQESCAQLFECSCPELDELTRVAREAGAYGSRLTGAGWGGCTVSLVAEENVEEFIRKVSESYAPYHGFTSEELHEVIFATKPSSGACVFEVGQ
ncbi:galactokinase gal [Ramaria rubella]|nr:galactokinase gal [Ramaria rubella]